MKSLGIRQAKAHLSALVRAASKGECSLVTDNGKLVAMIAPPPDPTLTEAPMQSADDAPPPSDEAPPLFDDDPPPFDEAPLPAGKRLPAANEAPPLTDRAPRQSNPAAFRHALLSAPYPLELDF